MTCKTVAIPTENSDSNNQDVSALDDTSDQLSDSDSDSDDNDRHDADEHNSMDHQVDLQPRLRNQKY